MNPVQQMTDAELLACSEKMLAEASIMQCELSAEARNELAAMAYARWSDAYEKLMDLKTATWESMDRFCPKADWPSFKEAMQRTAQKEYDLASRLTAEICKYSPLICGE